MSFINNALVGASSPDLVHGDPNSDVLMVLEHLNAYDLKDRRLYSGPPGSVYDLAFGNAQLPKTSLFTIPFIPEVISAQTKHRYYKSTIRSNKKVASFTSLGLKYKQELIARIKELQPKLIIASGEATIFALTGNIGQLIYRGSVYENPETGIPVLCTINANISSFGNKKSKAALEGRTEVSPYIYRYYLTCDIKKAKHFINNGVNLEDNRNLIIEPFFNDVITYLDSCHDLTTPIGVDIECANYNVSCLGIAKSANEAMCIPFDKRWSETQEIAIWNRVDALMRNESITKVFQNGLFDIWFMALVNKIRVLGPIEDTMVGNHIMYPDFHKGLDFLVSVYTTWPYYKDEGKIWKNPNPTYQDLQNHWTYNAKDAAVTLECWPAIENMLKAPIDEEGNKHYTAYRDTMDLYPALLYWMINGVAVDQTKIQSVKEVITKKIAETRSKIEAICGEGFNPGSPKQCQEYFYGRLRIPPYTKMGKREGKPARVPTTDDTAMARLARGTSTRAPLKEAALIQDFRRYSKLKSTYLDIDYDTDGRFRCAVNPRGTTTGRLSTSKTIPFNTGMNMQNLPPAFKVMIVPDDGFFFWEQDKRQAEWVVSAYVFDEPAMQHVIESGLDPHAATACYMEGLDMSCIPIIKEEDSLIGHTTDPEEIAAIRNQLIKTDPQKWGNFYDSLAFLPRTMSLRQCGKKSNHGLNYGETFRMFALINEIMEQEAKIICDKYHEVYPGINAAHDRIEQTLSHNHRTLINPYGRIRTFRDRWGPDMFKEAYAYIPQSTVGDLVNRAIKDAQNMWEDDISVDYFCPGKPHIKFQNSSFMGQVHDSVLGQSLIGDAGDMTHAAKDIMAWKYLLDRPVPWKDSSFIVHTDLKVSAISWGDLKDCDYTPSLEDNIKEVLASEKHETQTNET